MNTTTASQPFFIEGDGEMARLINNYDWPASALGSRQYWSRGLVSTIQLLLDATFPMFLFWGRNQICFYNDAAIPALGKDKHPVALGSRGRLVWKESWELLEPMINSVKESGRSCSFEDLCIPVQRNGKMVDAWWTFNCNPVRNDEGKIEGVLFIGQETTNKRAHQPGLVARKELEDSEKRFRNLVQEAPVATAVYTGREMKIQWANDAMIKLWGKDKSVIGKTVREALPELEGQPFHQLLDDVFTTGTMYQGTEDPGHLMVDGKLQSFYFNFSYKPLRDTNGEIYGILNMAIDVTESIKVKRRLEESERNFRSLIMQAPIGIALLTGTDHIVELANDEYLELVGREREGFVGKPIWELIPEAKEQGFDIILQKVKETGEPFLGNEIPVMLLRNSEPETVFLDFVYEPLFDEERNVHSILVIAINVTRQVNARKLVESAEERTRLAIESASLGSYEVNLKTRKVHGTQRFNELFDVDPDSDREDFVSRIHPADFEKRQKAHEEAQRTGTLDYECRVVRRDGTQNWIHAFGKYYFDIHGNPEKIIGIIKDITKEKIDEQELERRVKERTEDLTKLNEELQQFTYVSSHDLKEPLRKIHVFTGIIRDRISVLAPELLHYSDKVTASTQRMSTLLNDLLNYSSLSDTSVSFEPVYLNHIIKNILEDVEVSLKEKKAIVRVGELPVINGIPFQVNQLFYNLINNALKFTSPGRQPLIEIRCSETTDSDLPEYNSSGQKAFYKIEVIDNGIGFEQEYADKIFVVFQRLHPRHEYSGNGIGLSICKKIVQNHKGMIYARSAPGSGSRFIVLWPKEQGE